MPKIRLSPSGPVIANAQGGALQFGDGALLRQNQQVFAIVGTNSDALTGADYVLGTGAATPQTDPVVCSLPDADAGLFYDFRAEIDVTNEDAGNGTINVRHETAPDAAGPWTAQFETAHTVGADAGAAGSTFTARRVVSQTGPIQGATLGVAAATPNLFYRAVAFAPTGSAVRVQSTAPDGSNVLTLNERF